MGWKWLLAPLLASLVRWGMAMAAPRMRGCALVVCVLLSTSSCVAADDTKGDTPEPSPGPVRTLPDESASPSGRLRAEMRQSSIDASLGRMQVWITNDTRADRLPGSIVYRDDRLPAPLRVEDSRLRTVPAGSERGFPLVLPARLDCDAAGVGDPSAEGTGRLVLRTSDRPFREPVSDETDVVGRFVTLRCAEQSLAEAATLRWAARISVDHPGPGARGTLTLVVRPTGAPGHVLRIDAVVGSHLFASAEDPPVWEPAVTVRSDGPLTRIPLPLTPARCDPHAFVEGGGATAFRVRFHLDGAPGEVLLRMDGAGRKEAFAFARESCGLG